MATKDLTEFAVSSLVSYATGELLRYGGRQAGYVDAGRPSDVYAAMSGGMLVGGSKMVMGQNVTAPWLVGSALGSIAAAARPKLFSSEKEQTEALINDMTKGAIAKPESFKTSAFGWTPQEIAAGKQKIGLPQPVAPGAPPPTTGEEERLVEEAKPLVIRNLTGSEWLKRATSTPGDPTAFDPGQTIKIASYEEFHEIGGLFALSAMMSLSKTDDFAAKRLVEFFRTTKFEHSFDFSYKRTLAIYNKLDTMVGFPEMISYPSGYKYGGLLIGKDAVQSYEKLWRLVHWNTKEKDWLAEYALLWFLNAGLVESDVGPVFEQDNWRDLAAKAGDIIWNGVKQAAGALLLPIAGSLLAWAGVKAVTVPVAGWIAGACTAIVAAVVAVIGAIASLFDTGSKFKEFTQNLVPQGEKFLKLVGGYTYDTLPCHKYRLLIDGGVWEENKLWQIFTYQENWLVAQKIIAQLPVFYHKLPFSLPCWKDWNRTSYIGTGNGGRAVSFDDRVQK
jgi:hypothetical protein